MNLKTQLAALLLVITSATILPSCDKDNDDPQKTKTELLTAAPWKRTALISTPAYDWNADGNASTDVLSIMRACEKDNFEIYKTNGVVETYEGATKCDPSDPQSWSVSWMFTDNESKLVFDGTDEYTLLELTATTLKFQSTFEENGVTYTHVETFEH